MVISVLYSVPKINVRAMSHRGVESSSVQTDLWNVLGLVCEGKKIYGEWFLASFEIVILWRATCAGLCHSVPPYHQVLQRRPCLLRDRDAGWFGPTVRVGVDTHAAITLVLASLRIEGHITIGQEL